MTHAHERMAADPHDRIAWLRDDEKALAERWADPATRVLVIAGSRIRPDGEQVAWVSPAVADEQAAGGIDVLLGEHDGRTYFARLLPSAVADDEWVGVRAVLSSLLDAGPEGPLVLHAIGLAEWHLATRHCARCGGALASRRAGHELVCRDCDRPTFPRSDPAVIMLVTTGEPGTPEEACLLGRQAAWPPGRYSTLAGFCEPGETLEDAVRREVYEETRVVVGDVRYFGSQGWPLPASLMLGFFGRAATTEIAVDQDEIEDARWFTRADLRAGTEAGELVPPSGVSISRGLLEDWYGAPLTGSW